jgi:hypothetical protein
MPEARRLTGLVIARSPRPRPSAFEAVRDADDGHTFFEEERAFEQERALVVQEVPPPPGGDELGQHDRDEIVTAFFKRSM